jgi:phenylpropionate dioxygenase-like ring-hydroxylating dioxygenase large terminal subunit
MSKTSLIQPRQSGFSSANWQLLTRFWHPVALTSEIGEKPYSFTLLDLRLVAFRTSAGYTVALDRCPHRGSSFGLGWIEEDRLVCGYHGLRYDAEGRCVAIPSSGPGVRIPAGLCLRVFRAQARFSILWVSLTDEPIYPLPEWGPLEETGLQKLKMSPGDWNCSAARHVENFNDVAHFSWIHAGTFGDPSQSRTPRYKVEPTATGLFRKIKVKQVDRDSFARSRGKVTEMTYSYDFTYPFSSYLKIAAPDGRDEHIFDTIRPIGADRSRVFILKARNYDLDQPVDDWISFQEAVNQEDKAMVESQEPQDLPLDQGAEAHFAADAWSIAYRWQWKRLGLE